MNVLVTRPVLTVTEVKGNLENLWPIGKTRDKQTNIV